ATVPVLLATIRIGESPANRCSQSPRRSACHATYQHASSKPRSGDVRKSTEILCGLPRRGLPRQLCRQRTEVYPKRSRQEILPQPWPSVRQLQRKDLTTGHFLLLLRVVTSTSIHAQDSYHLVLRPRFRRFFNPIPTCNKDVGCSCGLDRCTNVLMPDIRWEEGPQIK